MPLGVGTPRDEQPRHPGHHARRTHRATNSLATRVIMRDVVYRVTNRLYNNRM
ncbi:MAG: hypothetical protein ACKOCH_23540 [Bacteroidota bacterium]